MMEQRNLLLAVVLSISILLIWQMLFEQPRLEKEMAARRIAEQQATAQKAESDGKVRPPSADTSTAPSPGAASQVPIPVPTPQPAARAPAAPPAGAELPAAPLAGKKAAPKQAVRTKFLARSPRLRLASPRLRGSIRLTGGQIDDLTLADYRETTSPDSPVITLLSPAGAKDAYYAQFGWVASDGSMALPGTATRWTANRTELNPRRPVKLRWDNGKGLSFTRIISIDDDYMFTVTQRVRNSGTKPVTLYPYGLISRSGTPETLGYFILHEGLLGVFNDQLEEVDYDDLQEAGSMARQSRGGWIGITDKYWLTALVPDQKARIDSRFRHFVQDETDKYQVDYLGGGQTVPPGGTIEASSRLFAGAKVVEVLDRYAEKDGIIHFDLAVDWGWFRFLTKPIFYVLDYFNGLMGNFGLAILLLTVIIKLLFFPLANKSYVAMSKMKKLQPKMTKIRERYKDDRAKQNEAMMKLYKDENANPASGCMPIFIQLPVFFALYKVLFVSIEMRHAPFYGWIHDLSAPDPTSLFNLFGLIPWVPPEFLVVGVWPVIMGASMFLQQKMNPAPADPMQAKMFMFLPFVFTFLFARFPAGLVIYWAWNNGLSIAQQWVIMRRMGVKIGGT